MDSARMQLFKGAVKSAIAALSATTIGTNLIDPAKFSVMTKAGIEHTLLLGAIVVGGAEVRYFKQWLEKWSAS